MLRRLLLLYNILLLYIFFCACTCAEAFNAFNLALLLGGVGGGFLRITNLAFFVFGTILTFCLCVLFFCFLIYVYPKYVATAYNICKFGGSAIRFAVIVNCMYQGSRCSRISEHFVIKLYKIFTHFFIICFVQFFCCLCCLFLLVCTFLIFRIRKSS